ncbi:recombination-associated protein RdgC [Halomonas daqingensis]|uniref:Recombination-associated protein RdgC n=1 Tax=Billgrantia desiderata TaxID=52021 RepID=A0ABS9B4E0_9GAMM|nr:recombination-associated protein RdgC [Halomonas desiderata]MCE8042482.1 recombination-associated protein RdgC [Halomonas desiderata]MCE8047057.1 recombination-associated protein RdgC [Halomonas desiderata]
MWFKNLYLYRVHDAATWPASFEEALSEQAARPIGSQEARRIGWTAPAGRAGTALLHELQGHRLITAERQERILPPAVVREEVDERASEIEQREGRKLRRQERQELKEHIYEELLPQAFVKFQRIDVWWDTNRSLIAVNTSSRKRAEEALDLLRETLGSVKVTPLATQTLPMRAMTQWLEWPERRPAALLLGDHAVLTAPGENGTINARHVDLDDDEIQGHRAAGRQVQRLAIEIESVMSFVLHDDLAIKSIRFDDILLDEASETEDDGDAVIRLEADFLLMTRALGASIDSLIAWMGGEANLASEVAA